MVVNLSAELVRVGGQLELVFDVTVGHVAIRVVVDLECRLVLGADLKASAGPVSI
jgi:hypothetical protein